MCFGGETRALGGWLASSAKPGEVGVADTEIALWATPAPTKSIPALEVSNPIENAISPPSGYTWCNDSERTKVVLYITIKLLSSSILLHDYSCRLSLCS